MKLTTDRQDAVVVMLPGVCACKLIYKHCSQQLDVIYTCGLPMMTSDHKKSVIHDAKHAFHSVTPTLRTLWHSRYTVISQLRCNALQFVCQEQLEQDLWNASEAG